MSFCIHHACERRLSPLASYFFYLSVCCLSFYSCAQDSPVDIQEPEKTKEEQTTDQSDNRPEEDNQVGEQPSRESDPKGSGETPESDSRPQAHTLQELEAMTYELEVIFHVLASSSSELNEKITSERVENILNGVNRLYAGIFGGANTRIRFVPARKNPEGQVMAEPGIVRTSIAHEKLSYKSVRLDAEGGVFHKQSWNIKKYPLVELKI